MFKIARESQIPIVALNAETLQRVEATQPGKRFVAPMQGQHRLGQA
ncbi:MAG: hypothetical protein ACYTG0_45135 [Planctomycetota bacterium]